MRWRKGEPLGHRLSPRDGALFSALPPADGELAAAAAWAGEQFAAYFEGLPVDFERAERLVAVGGTVTTLVALVHELEPYDSNFVHLRELTMEQISAAIDRMSMLDVEGIAATGCTAQTRGRDLGWCRGDSRLMRAAATGRLP